MVADDTATVAYQAANRLFAKEIALHVSDDDSIWIHDYHLMLLPQFLREELGDTKSNDKIGFFLHTPFPDSSDFSIVPLKDQILRGVLGLNPVGFPPLKQFRHLTLMQMSFAMNPTFVI
jgi:trehalose 6-phosphate synthase